MKGRWPWRCRLFRHKLEQRDFGYSYWSKTPETVWSLRFGSTAGWACTRRRCQYTNVRVEIPAAGDVTYFDAVVLREST